MLVPRRCPWLALFVTCCLSGAARAQEAAGSWVPLFDGKTLNGWHVVGELPWIVEEGAIVGRITERSKLYSLLVSDQVFSDFTVRLKFKTVEGNSGFYIRTVLEEPDRAHGLQVEVDPHHNSGGIYESYNRAWVDKPSEELQAKYFKPGEWNEFLITAYGGNVEVKVNGITSAKLQDDPSRPAGQLAMQMHAGNEMLVLFKDIEIRAVPRVTPAVTAPTQPAVVQPDPKGRLRLAAKTARLSGQGLVYLPAWEALSDWRDAARAEWDVEVVKPGTYDVYLEWSADAAQAGNLYALIAGEKRLEGTVALSGSREVYRRLNVGQIELAGGAQKIALQPNGPLKTTLIDLREVLLVPAKKK